MKELLGYYLIQAFLLFAYGLICPLLAAHGAFKWFQAAKVTDLSRDLCIKVFVSSTFATFAFMWAVNAVGHFDLGPGSLLSRLAVGALFQCLLVTVFFKKFTPSAILIGCTTTLLMYVAVSGLAIVLQPREPPIVMGRVQQ